MARFFSIIFMVVVFLSVTATGFAEPTPVQPSGGGTEEDPYQISSLAELYWITQNTERWSKHYRQTANIDASGTSSWDSGAGWTPVGNLSTQFTGSYDGDGHTISKLFINRGGTVRVGFFGRIEDPNGTVRNICLTDVNITGGGLTGGLVGQLYGTVSNSCVTGSVTESSYSVGGLVGQGESSSSISNCYSTATVSGTSQVGGLAGTSAGYISKCYSTGNVSGTSCVGGLVGISDAMGFSPEVSHCYSKGDVTRTSGTQTSFGGFCGRAYIDMGGDVTIEKCYSIGSVSYEEEDPTDKGFVGDVSGTPTYTNNFFDSEASNQSTATGATGKTTTEMKTQSTFTDAGWNFTAGTGIWTINASLNNGYPYLQDTPLLVELTSFTAQGSNNYVLLTWETASEIDNAGFHLWRSDAKDGEYLRITEDLISAEGGPTWGAEYEYEDFGVEVGPTYFYELEDIDYAGVSTFHGPVSATLGDGAETIVLIYPEDGALIPLYPPAAFEWDGAGLERFKLEFSRSPDFTSKVIVLPSRSKRRSPWITEESCTPTRREWRSVQHLGLSGKMIYWAVFGEDEAGKGFDSEAFELKIGTPVKSSKRFHNSGN